MLRWLAHLALHRYRAVLAGSAVAMVLAGLVLWHGGAFTSGTTQGIESAVVQELLGRDLAYPGDSSFLVLFRSRELDWRDRTYRAALAAALAPLRADPRVGVVDINALIGLSPPRPERAPYGPSELYTGPTKAETREIPAAS